MHILRADVREGAEDSNSSLFKVRQFTEWPGPLRWVAFPVVELLIKPLIHWIASPPFAEKPFSHWNVLRRIPFEKKKIGSYILQYPLARNQYINNSPGIFSCIRTRAKTGKYSWGIIYVLVSCQGVLQYIGADFFRIRKKINSPRIFSCMYRFCAGGQYFPTILPSGVDVTFLTRSQPRNLLRAKKITIKNSFWGSKSSGGY